MPSPTFSARFDPLPSCDLRLDHTQIHIACRSKCITKMAPGAITYRAADAHANCATRNFYHAGHGIWYEDLPPAAATYRTSVIGPDTARWQAHASHLPRPEQNTDVLQEGREHQGEAGCSCCRGRCLTDCTRPSAGCPYRHIIFIDRPAASAFTRRVRS